MERKRVLFHLPFWICLLGAYEAATAESRDKPPSTKLSSELTPDIVLLSGPTADTDVSSDELTKTKFPSHPSSGGLALSEATLGIAFYCTVMKNVVVRFDGNVPGPFPSTRGMVDGRVCDQHTRRNVVVFTCKHGDRPVNLLIESPGKDMYSRATVKCPVRISRENPVNSADDEKQILGKANAVMEIGLKYDNISEIEIGCLPEGNVFVTNPDHEVFKHILTYNTGGPSCVPLLVREDVVEISDCNQRKTIEIVFSSDEIKGNIIGGKVMLRIYKFNCTDFVMNSVFYTQEIFQHGGTSGMVTWLTYLTGILIGPVLCFIMS